MLILILLMMIDDDIRPQRLDVSSNLHSFLKSSRLKLCLQVTMIHRDTMCRHPLPLTLATLTRFDGHQVDYLSRYLEQFLLVGAKDLVECGEAFVTRLSHKPSSPSTVYRQYLAGADCRQ